MNSTVMIGRSAKLSGCILAFTATLLLALAACPAFGAGTHACDYLRKEEVAQVLGASVGEVQRQPANPMGQSVCFFDIPAGMAVRFAQIQMFRTSWAQLPGDGFTAPALFENNMSFLDNLQEVSAVGEKAYWGGSGMKLGAGLHILYKDAYFTVQAATGDEQMNLENSKQLASLVLKKIN